MMVIRIALCAVGIMVWGSAALSFEIDFEVLPQGGANEVSVIIEDSTPPPSGNWTGYAVVRYLHGACEDPVFLTEVLPFSEPVQLIDSLLPEYYAYSYVVALIDDAGFPGSFADWEGIDTLGGLDHPILRGRLESGGVFGGGVLVACPDMCWELPFFTGLGVGVMSAPDEVSDAIDSGQVFDIYGDIAYFFEGPFIPVITEGVPTECGVVSSSTESWSALKRRFR